MKQYGALLVVDAVTSLSGCELDIDKLGIDLCYSGTQKCLNCPPGLSPVTVNEKAFNVIYARKTKVQSLYLDFTLLREYWGQGRVYHHTAPVNMIYGLRESLRIIYEEGLDARFQRHLRNHAALVAGLEALGLEMHVKEGLRLPSLNTVRIPPGVEDQRIRRALLEEFQIEIGGGLGSLQGKVWRIGLMGHSSTPNNVILCLRALGTLLKADGHVTDAGVGVSAAMERYASWRDRSN